MQELFVEFVIPLLVFFVLRSILRNLFSPRRERPLPDTPPPPPSRNVTLHKDPVCGTYVSADSAVAQKIDGEVVYFCSPECRDRYRQRAS